MGQQAKREIENGTPIHMGEDPGHGVGGGVEENMRIRWSCSTSTTSCPERLVVSSVAGNGMAV